MSSLKKPRPMFRPGDWVSFDFGPNNRVEAEVVEDRGPLGIRGRRLYRVQVAELGEASAFELPEEVMVKISPPVRQSYEIRYSPRAENEWGATTKVGGVYRGVKASGVVGENNHVWEGNRLEDLTSLTIRVLVETPSEAENPLGEQVTKARRLADEEFRSRHPRARIIHEPDIR